MIVNDQSPYVGQAPGKFQGLDLLTPLYIGAVPDFRNIHKQAGFSQGFVGKKLSIISLGIYFLFLLSAKH